MKPEMARVENVTGSAVPTYSYAEWPVVVVRMPPQALSASGFEAHLAACRKPFDRGERFAMLIDMGDHPPLPAVQRKAVARAMSEDNQRYPGLLVALAIVVHSPLARGVMTAINWVVSPLYAFAAFQLERRAKEWLREHMLRTAKG